MSSPANNSAQGKVAVQRNVEPAGVLAARVLRRTNMPPLVSRAGWVTMSTLLLSFVAMAWVPWQQSIKGAGKVMAQSPIDREQSIDAPISGRILRWFVMEGSVVKEGDPIVELADVDPNYVERLQQRRRANLDRISAAESREGAYGGQERAYVLATQLKVKAAALKVKMGEQKVIAAAQRLQAAEAELHTVQLNLKRQEQLEAQGLASGRALELAQLDYVKAQAELNLRRAALSEEQSNLTALRADQLGADADGTAKIQSASAEAFKTSAEVAYAQEDLAKLEVELSRQASRLVTAPRAGVILSIHGGQGGKVTKAGDGLAILVPDTKSRAVELWIDGRDMPLISKGRPVRLRFEGWPAVQFVGWPSVAVGTFGGRVSVVDATTTRSGAFRVLVMPDPNEPPWPSEERLRQGLRAQGWILLDQVSMGWELWRQFNGFPPTVEPVDIDNPLGSNVKSDAKADKDSEGKAKEY